MNYNETENPMILDTYDYDTDWEEQDEIWSEKEDREWEESVWNQ